MTVVIVGAGITGLTVGYKLQEQGIPCIIIEKDEKIGGLARSYKWSGIQFDLGPHFILSNSTYPDALKFIKEILDNRYYELKFRIGIDFSGNCYPWPPDIIKMLADFPLSVSIHHLRRLTLRKNSYDDSFERGMIMRHGNYLYDNFFSPYIKKKTGISGEKLHINWWLKPIKNINQGNLNYEDKLMKAKMGKIAELIMLLKKFILSKTKALYPTEGFEAIPAILADKFTRKGGIIRTGIKNLQLGKSRDTISEIALDGRENIPVDKLVWTAPIDTLAGLLKISEPEITYIPLLLCFVRLNKTAKKGKYLYIYYGDSDIIFNRAYFPSNIADHFVPPEKDAICLEITPTGDDMLRDKRQLFERVIMDMEKVGLCPRNSVEGIETLFIENAHPIYTLTYKDALYKFISHVGIYKNICLAGRTGAFSNILTDTTVKLGLDTAEDIMIDLQNREQK